MGGHIAFSLQINGKKAVDGRDWVSIQSHELARLFTPGDNVLAATVTHTKGVTTAGWIGKVTVFLADRREITVATGPHWKASDRDVPGSDAPNFDDSSWPEAREFAMGPWAARIHAVPEGVHAPWLRKTFFWMQCPRAPLPMST